MIYQPKPRLGIQLNKKHKLAKGLVGCWLMNEQSGNLVQDLSGEGNHGTNNGATWVPEGLSFNGTSDKVTITGYKGIIGSEARTIVCKFKTTDSSAGLLFYGDSSGIVSAATMGFSLESGVIWLRMNVGVTAHWSSGLNDGNWHTFIYTYESGKKNNEAMMYIDGVKTIGTFNNGTTILNTISDADFQMGVDRSQTIWLDGALTYIMVYNRALLFSEAMLLNRELYVMFQRQIDLALTYYETPSALSIITDGFGAFGSIANIILEGYHQGATIGNPMWYYQMLKRRN